MSTELGLPFALRKHVPAAVPPKEWLGDPDQEWTWKPSGNFDTRDLEIYASTTLADLLTPPLGANPFSTMRASARRQSSEEFEDCVAHGGQSWLRRRAVDSFFSTSLLRAGGAGGRRKRSLS